MYCSSKCTVYAMWAIWSIPPSNKTYVPNNFYICNSFVQPKPPCQSPDFFKYSHHTKKFLHFLSYITLSQMTLKSWGPEIKDILLPTPVKKLLVDDSASTLTEPSRGNQPMLTFSDTSSETNPSSQDQRWIEDVESLFMVDRLGTHCTIENAETSLD